MNLKTKLAAIAVAPLLVVAGITGWLIYHQASRLIEAEILTIEERILSSKRLEIENYIRLAQTSINHIYELELNGRAAAQGRVRQMLHDMTFGEDGYFFVYDETGTNLVHPKLPQLVGRNWWNLQDPNGDYVIRNLIEKAKAGGGFHRYVWDKPSTGKPVDKIGYAVFLDKWGWMFGTGLYLDDIALEVKALEDETRANVRQTFIILFAVNTIAVLIVAVLLVIIRLNEQKLADQKLKQLTKRIIDTQEEERKRVSRELHDGISQLLVSVRYTLDLAQTKSASIPDVGSLVGRSAGILANAIAEVRRISMDLRPSILDDMGLAAALKSLAADFQDQTRLRVSADVTETGARISGEAKTALYRIAQEALTNIAKHANASMVDIALHIRGNVLVLRIDDNGNGMDFNKDGGMGSSKGLGIRNMRERAESHDGTLDITQHPLGGTRLEVRIPVTRFAEAAE